MAQGTFSGLISIDHAWQSVSLEERLELVSRSQATGVLAALAAVILIGCIAYGFDQIWLLGGGAATSIFIYPLFSSYTWRREKPALILAYLAVRAVARRYAYGYNIGDLDIILIYRGRMRELFRSKEEEAEYRQQQNVDIDVPLQDYKDVWIVLMRGGVVILSERPGGAKLEFITYITHESVLRKPKQEENAIDDRSIVIEGALSSKGRSVILTTRFPAAQYVFEKRFLALVEENKITQQSLEKLRQNQHREI